MSVRAAGRLREAAEFENIIVKAGPDGTLVRLSDVGNGGARRRNVFRRRCGSRASSVGFGCPRPADGQRARVQRGRRPRRWRDCASRSRRACEYRIAFDTTTVVQESIREVVETLLEAVGLVVLVMFVFLQSWRATLIPALTMPVSLIGAFAFVNLLGFSINTLTLFAIVLATGIVVDDAIVVIENIERHIQEYGKPPLQAASDAMREVFGAVIATALVLIAVFVPVAFFPGTTGRLYQQFALTIAFSVAISAFNALTLTPALSALLLRHAAARAGQVLRRGRTRRCSAGTDLYVRVRARTDARAMGDGRRVRRPARPDLLRVQPRAPARSCPRRTPATSSPRPGAARRVARIHDQRRRGGREDSDGDARSRVGVLACGFSFAGSAPNQGMIFTLLKPFEERERRRTAHSGAAAAAARAAVRHPGRTGIPFAPPAHQPRQLRRVRDSRCSIRAAAADIEALGSGTSRRWSARRSSRPGGRTLQPVHGERPAARGGHRSREGAKPGPADQRDHQRDADLSRVGRT